MAVLSADSGGGTGAEPLGTQYKDKATGAVRQLHAPTVLPGPNVDAPRYVPRYVRACAAEAWTLDLWRVSAALSEPTLRVPFRCHSWRHEGSCRRWIAAQNFSRLQTALACHPATSVVYAVLTLDQRRWASKYAAFESLYTAWTALRRSLVRELGGPLRYASTVEQHRSGWPHVNVLMVHADLALAVGPPSDDDVALTVDERRVLGWFKPLLVASGFGYMATIQRARDARAVAGYLVKLAADLDATVSVSDAAVSEVVKFTQVPEQAPPHFRRLRSSPKFLPPARPETEWTGQLTRAPLAGSTRYDVDALSWDANPRSPLATAMRRGV